ncbi:universal stress protein [Virgibacillus sp. NKC19-3]|uniref:universal stress protein n=1 Tax=Virgibacillus saliphilus TaxID=2831674 RepID=UPI001C9B40FB|nr:universal stress protein [Virgibacillus sp. NKC19-3]MBY7142797.1 universal stress protein [Virgibacillus sp. NKC19-3]
MGKKILVAYDGSYLSKQAIHEAKYQAKQEPETEIHVISVVRPAGPSTNAIMQRNIEKELADNFRPEMQQIKEEFESEGISIEADVLISEHKNPGEKVCEYANDNAIDLIIVGSRGISNVRKIFLGSVSNNIVQNANCRVLVIK